MKKNIMSFESWKKEYYPVDASSEEAMEAPVEHSLRKWKGLRLPVLEKHELQKFSRSLYSSDTGFVFSVDSSTCALCEKYRNCDGTCTRCPLYQIRGNISCTMKTNNETISPYEKFMGDNDPEPMIHWLEKALTISK